LPTKHMYAFLFSPTRATCLASCLSLDFIILIIFSGLY
jgi:hypothetical protein